MGYLYPYIYHIARGGNFDLFNDEYNDLDECISNTPECEYPELYFALDYITQPLKKLNSKNLDPVLIEERRLFKKISPMRKRRKKKLRSNYHHIYIKYNQWVDWF